MDLRQGWLQHIMTASLLIGVQVAGGVGGARVPRAPVVSARAMTVTVGRHPSAIAVDEMTARAFIIARGTLDHIGNPVGPGTVSILDTRRGVVRRTVSIGIDPSAIAVDEMTARAFVVDGGAFDSNGIQTGPGSVSVIDAGAGRVLRTVSVGISPAAVAVDQQAGRVLVVNRGASGAAGTVSIIDARSGALLQTMRVGLYPTAVAIDAPLGRAFVANFVSDTVSLVDVKRGRVQRTITLGPSPGTLAAVTVDARTAHVFVLSLPPRSEDESGSDLGRLTMLDATTGRVVRTIGFMNPVALGIDQRTGHAFVSQSSAQGGLVSLIDTRRGTVLRTVAIGHIIDAVTVDEGTERVFVLDPNSQTVQVLDARTGQRLCTMVAGKYPTAVAVDARTSHVFVVNSDDHTVSILPLC
jgi:YVTN family beta-propeller protein